MEKLQFKTNIKCEGCVAKVTPFLNEEKSISQWKVDTATAEKLLTVEGNELDEESVVETVKKAGFNIERK